MSSIVFEPWIGNKYFTVNRFGVRVLVLGESHYGDDSEIRPTATTEVVRLYAQDRREAFFTKVSKVLLGIDENIWLDNKSRGEVWEHIAFYNYIQEFVGLESRIRPSTQMWAAAQLPLFEVLDILRPDVVLVLGKELAAQLPRMPVDIEVCRIQHPSTGFVYKDWIPLFLEALLRARKKVERLSGQPQKRRAGSGWTDPNFSDS